MSPITHFLTGWALANSANFIRRDRTVVTLAAVMPDIDGLGAIPELLTRNTSHPLLWFSQYHHSLHTLMFAIVVAIVSFALAQQRWKTAALALLAFHVHLLEDLLGARGPDGLWSIPYFLPFSPYQWTWAGQWPLNGWQNYLLTAGLLMVTFFIAWKYCRSPLEIVSIKADRAFVAAVHHRFPSQAGPGFHPLRSEAPGEIRDASPAETRTGSDGLK